MEELITKVIEKLEEIEGLSVTQINYTTLGKEEAFIKIKFNNNIFEYRIEAKTNFNPVQLNQMEIFGSLSENQILFSEYFKLSVRSELRKKNINYADTTGNVFIKSGLLYLFIEGKKNNLYKKVTSSKNYGSAGLKLIYAFLTDNTLINKNYREISAYTGLSLDSISRTLKELKKQGFLVDANIQNKILVRKKELFDKWVSLYAEILKPKISRGKFKSLNHDFLNEWKNMAFEGKTLWGGEPAANRLDNYIRPEFFTIYTAESNEELLKKYKLIKSSDGKIEIFDFFLKEKFPSYERDNYAIVHPILIYADLMNTDNPRNVEAAKTIFEKHLNELISET